MVQIITGVYLLSSFLGIGAWGANVYLLVDDDLTLVDTGLPGRADLILEQIEELGYSPSDIKRIIITHYHADHTGSLAALKRATQAEVIAHPADAPYIDGTLPQPGPARPQWLSKLPILDGIKILHTPGHTPGSICLYLQSKDLLIAGDLLAHRFGLKLPSKSFTIDIVQEIQSVKRVAGLEFDIICFGHGSPIMRDANHTVADFADRLTPVSKSAE
jgi:glyoxylase-like metal-dependent hydrolase (beta-lactamase superfamily II)